MNVLIACEESQTITKEFRKEGINAFSCDIVECSGGHPEWHIQGDVLPILDGNCVVRTLDGKQHEINGKWDLIIAHPPCTYLTVTGNRWFNVEKYGDKALKRIKDRDEAIEFFMKFVNADCEHIAIENPVGIMSTVYAKPTQIIQPYMFGDAAEKKTCLWLKNLPNLEPTDIVAPPPRKKFESGKTMAAWYADCWKMSKEDRARMRSKTFDGIAKAIVSQWKEEI